jgi:hypothetical protein
VVRCCRHGNGAAVKRALAEIVADFARIEDVAALWRCLRLGSPQLARLPAEARQVACLALITPLGERIRLQALPALYELAPLVAAVGGSRLVARVFDAIIDAANWWPSYPALATT